MKKPIYLDYNATTPVAPEVAAAMRPYLEEHFGNPSSSHWYGLQTRQAVEKARRQVAELLGCFPDEIVLTSGGSESNNYAIRGAALACRDRGRHLITSAVEHPAVAEVYKQLENEGFEVTRVGVDSHGRVAIADVESALRLDTTLISIMHSNNEVGTLQPIGEIGKLARERGVLLHTDAAQSVGKIAVRVTELKVDLLTVVGHKMYAPKGVGALYIRRGLELAKLIHGADHESDRRAGTENVLLAVGLGEACRLASESLEQGARHMSGLRDRLYQRLCAELGEELPVNGHPTERLPGTLSISFAGVESDALLAEVTGVAASAGAACHADSVSISSVLEAMGLDTERALGTVRLSVGRMTTRDEVDDAARQLAAAVVGLRGHGAHPVAAAGDSGEIRLTRYTRGLGCACKLRPQLLDRILEQLPPPTDQRVLVGTRSADDAAVYALSENQALVQSVDFFTPIVDDPYDFGAIAAANAFSDIYAMGGRPVIALNVVGFPSRRLGVEVLERILAGASDKAAEAGVSIVGGHTVDDTEPKFGMAVTGFVHPRRIWTNTGARPEDALILTKPIGTGIATTALKRGLLEATDAEAVVRQMATLNRSAAEVLSDFEVSACTDVTGFGLLGHLLEMLRGSGVSAEIFASSVPILAGVAELVAAGVVPGGTESNLEHQAPWIGFEADVGRTLKIVLSDAQTSGGLLAAVPPDQAEDVLAGLSEAGVERAALIGFCMEPSDPLVRVRLDTEACIKRPGKNRALVTEPVTELEES